MNAVAALFFIVLVGFGCESMASVRGASLLQTFGPDDYNADGFNTDIAVRDDGRIFVANREGVLHFDGAGWQVLPLPDGRQVTAVERGPDGRIYVAGVGYVGVLDDAEDGSLRFLDLTSAFGFSAQGNGVALGDVWHVLSTPEGVWFNTDSELLFYGSPTQEFRRQTKFPGQRNPLVSGRELYGRVPGHGLLRLEGTQWVPVAGAEMLIKEGVTAIHPWVNGKLLVGADGFYLMRADGIRRLPASMPPELREPYYHPSVVTTDGELLVGAATGRVLRFDAELRLVEQIAVGRHVIREMALDHLGGVLVASEGGIARLPPRGPWTKVDASHGIETAVIDFAWHRGSLWLGTPRGLQRLHNDHDGVLQAEWMGSNRDAVYQLNSTGAGLLVARASELLVLEGDAEPRRLITEPFAYIRTLVPSEQGDRAYAYGNRFLWVLRRTEGRWRPVADLPIEGADRWRSGVEVAPGEVWFGVKAGGPVRVQVDPRSGQLLSIDDYGAADGLRLSQVGTVVNFLDGRLYAISGEEVHVWDGQRFVADATTLFADEGRNASVLPSVVAGEHGTYVVATRRVLHRPTGSTEWRPLGGEGALSWLRGGSVGSDGVLRLLTQSGELLQYDPTLPARPADEKLPVILTSVQLNEAGAPAQRLAIPDPEVPLVLPVGSSLSLRWGVLSLAPDLKFRLRVDGVTAGWTEWEPTGKLETQLSRAGDFTIVLDGQTESGREVLPRKVRLRVVPKWYQAPWLNGLLVLLAATGFAYATVWTIRWRTGRYLRREAELESRIAERTNELEIANQKLVELAVKDSLTGLANRRALEQGLQREWLRCGEMRQPLAILMIDVDRFKHYNDTYGHLAGDDVLRTTATQLREQVAAPRELLARFGGEEFALLVPGASLLEAVARAEALRAHVAAGGDGVTVSVGVAAWIPSDPAGPSALINAADQALYRAKRAGRNRVEAAEPRVLVPGRALVDG